MAAPMEEEVGKRGVSFDQRVNRQTSSSSEPARSGSKRRLPARREGSSHPYAHECTNHRAFYANGGSATVCAHWRPLQTQPRLGPCLRC